jgi:hypothetical protein
VGVTGFRLGELVDGTGLVDEEEARARRQHVTAPCDRGDSAHVPVERHRADAAAAGRQRRAVKATAEDVDPQQLLALLVPPRPLAQQSRLERPRDDPGCRHARRPTERVNELLVDFFTPAA